MLLVFWLFVGRLVLFAFGRHPNYQKRAPAKCVALSPQEAGLGVLNRDDQISSF